MPKDKEEAIKALELFRKEYDKYTIKNYNEFAEEMDLISSDQIRYRLGSWYEIKQDILFIPEFCKKCDVGRCRFNYNLDKCEYYEEE